MLFLLFFPSLISWSFLGPWRSASQCWLWYRVSPIYSWRPGYFHSCHSYLWFNIQYRLIPFLILFFPVFAEPSKVLHIGGISIGHPGGEQPREIARPPSLFCCFCCVPSCSPENFHPWSSKPTRTDPSRLLLSDLARTCDALSNF